MMAISNHLIVKFDYEYIDSNYDFFILLTSDNYISNGAYIIDKPIDVLKADSVVFDNGRSLFIMFKKNYISRIDLAKVLEDEKITVNKISPSKIKPYILVRLFLNGISNFESDENKYNNITGKLYIVDSKWINKNKKRFYALCINVDSDLYLSANAVSFCLESLFKNKKSIADLPRYAFSFNKNNALKRVLHKDSAEVYVRKSLDGFKAEIPFLSLKKDEIKATKTFYIYKTLDELIKRYKKCISIELERVDLMKTIGNIKDKFFYEKALRDYNSRKTIFTSYVDEKEYEEEFADLVTKFNEKTKSDSTVLDIQNSNNIVFIHNKDYYNDNNLDDPYKKLNHQGVIQCITVEDSSEKIINDNEAIFRTIIKEIVIKDDIINKKKISLDNWQDYKMNGPLIVGKEVNHNHYFMIIKPNGTFEFQYKLFNLLSFNDELLHKCSTYLSDNDGK